MSKTNTILFVANRGYALTSSRASIIQRFLSSDWNVVIATANDKESLKLCDAGVHLEIVNFNRGGFSPITDLLAYKRLLNIYTKWRPILIHHFHAKPVILGSIAAHRALGEKTQIVNTITGLGHAFITGGLSSKLAGLGYQLALPHTAVTIFQNHDDQNLFHERGWSIESKAKLIASSGVDTKYYSPVDRRGRDGCRPIIVMLGRLLRQKGIHEFAEVAHRIRLRWPEARFLLAGEEDPVHPDSVPAEWIRNQNDIEYLGRLSDITGILAEADLLLFPSYREGVPRVVLEAAAMGLPTVGFDVPGVREAVRDGETGYLVSDRDVDALTDRVATLLESEDLRFTMGKAARKLMEIYFDKPIIEEQYIEVYRGLGLKVE